MELEQGLVDKAWLLCGTAVAIAALAWIWWITEWVWLQPRRLERALCSQGLRGTNYRPLIGDLPEDIRLNIQARSKPMELNHDIAPRVLPLWSRAMGQYGRISFTWPGTIPRVTLMDPELMREVLANKFDQFLKPSVSPIAKQVFTGLVSHEGEKWATHRKILNPSFHVEKLKRMSPAFSACCDELIAKWDHSIGSDGVREIDVWLELQNFTGDVITRTAFGSSLREGRRIFQLQVEAAELFVKSVMMPQIPGYRFVPTPANRRRREIEREIRSFLRPMIEERERATKNGEGSEDDLLGMLLQSNIRYSKEHRDGKGNIAMTTDDMIDECKNLYFAGQETTSVLLTWTMIVLSMHPSWQERAREEVMQVYGKNKPDYDGLSRLKIVSMVLYEVLRLYPPVTFLFRRTCKTVKLGGITYPPGVHLTLPTIFIHHDPKYWGEDANEFRPERFAEGVSKASKDQVAFFPFGGGPRICIGQNFALIEAKMGLSLILQHFSFELSPSYAHAPCTILTLQTQHGAPLMLRRL